MAVPQQLGFHCGGDGGIADLAGEIGGLVVALHVGVDLQLIIHAVDTVNAQGHLLRQVAVDFGFHCPGEGGGAGLHIDINAERAEVAVESDGSPDGALLPRFAQLPADVGVVRLCGQRGQ